MEQHFELNVTNITDLDLTTISISDYQNSLTLSFVDTSPVNATQIRITSKTDEDILRDIQDSIRNQWGDDSNSSNLFTVPQIKDFNAGSNGFTLMALSGSVTTSNQNALAVRHLSNMLIQGSGFTRATPQISPSPTIFGYSDINASLPTFASPNGRPLFHYQRDNLTDDIYLYDSTTASNRRVSVTKFGFPTNYLDQANMSTHRFPSLSGDGRFIFFSSDAGGAGGIVFDGSNQLFNADNNRRDIFMRDMKTTALFEDNAQIYIDEDILNATNHTINLNSEYPILIYGEIPVGSFQSVALFVNGERIQTSQSDRSGSQAFNIYIPWTADKVGAHTLYAEITDNLGNIKTSSPIHVKVVETKGAVSDVELNVNPLLASVSIWLRVPVLNEQFGFITYPTVTGPFTRSEIESMVEQGLVLENTLAYYEGQGIFQSVDFFEIYPFRALVTNGSSLISNARFIDREGKQPSLSMVTFFLNGKKLSEHVAPPYSQIFAPPSLNDNGKSISSRWALTVMAKDTQGATFLKTEYGENLHSQVFPTMEIDLVNGISGFNENDILDGQVVTIDGQITGSHIDLQNVDNISLYANGIEFASSSGVDEVNINQMVSSTNNIFRINFNTLFDVEFDKYAKPDGSIELTAFVSMSSKYGFVPTFKSKHFTIKCCSSHAMDK